MLTINLNIDIINIIFYLPSEQLSSYRYRCIKIRVNPHRYYAAKYIVAR